MKLKVVNENYAARIVEIKNPRRHTNADRLLCWNVYHNNVITNDSTESGLMVYFPVECKISSKFLAENSLYRNSELNKDKEKSGFFEANNRVRAVKLRGEYSEGFVMPVESLVGFCDTSKLKKGDAFNEIDGEVIAEKYVPKTGRTGPANHGRSVSIQSFVDGQFKFHLDTANLAQNAVKFSLDDVISISYKIHGCSFTARKVLKKRKFWKFNLKPKYTLVASSRNTVKDMTLDRYDLWVDTAKSLEGVIYNGLSLYGEIAGYNKNGGFIQKGFDYGCSPDGIEKPFNRTFTYRITQTTPEGNVVEFSTTQIADFCQKFGLETPKVFFTGTVRDYCKSRGIDVEKPREEVLNEWVNKMKEEFNEKDCFMCENKQPEEGVVVRREGLEFGAYKLKSRRFVLGETKLLDEGIEIES